MKSICPLIADILPLYADGTLSEEGTVLVEEHLTECESCRKKYETFAKTEENQPTVMDLPSEQKARMLAKRIGRKRRMLALTVFALLLILSASFLSFLKFDTPNFLSAGIGLFRITFTDIDVVEIQKNPRVLLVKAEKSPYRLAIDSLAEEGYTELPDEQMGSMFVFEKDGERFYVHFSANRYFAKCSFR